MKFEQLTNEVYGAEKAGYILDTNYKVVVNPEAREILDEGGYTEPEIDNAIGRYIDSLFDFDGDLYRGEDGELYIVKEKLYPNGYTFFPVCWHRVKKSKEEN